MNNGKKEYPINGLEQDTTFARNIYCFVKNVRGIKRFVKNQLNRRLRRYNKNINNFE